ncbi:MAG: TlyA family RNA methyltransferase [Anaerolineales bacterium]|nr:MAG: TlyA family RNA methyltransferase [Anaerolineales bacterium]
MAEKSRIDVLMVERGLTESRALAQRLIMAGQVRLNGQTVHKASETAGKDGVIEIEALPKFVSRGGDKLEAALLAFEVLPAGWVCADVGASTGGFTDCLLQSGATSVYAIDVGKGQLHWRLRSDERVTCLEETNARYLDHLPEPVDLVVVDVSFISLALILPNAKAWLKPDGVIIALIKPQFEAGKRQVRKGGVVRDPGIHEQVLYAVLEETDRVGLYPWGLIQSPLKGPKGNIEFLVFLAQSPGTSLTEDLIKSVLTEDKTHDGG